MENKVITEQQFRKIYNEYYQVSNYLTWTHVEFRERFGKELKITAKNIENLLITLGQNDTDYHIVVKLLGLSGKKFDNLVSSLIKIKEDYYEGFRNRQDYMELSKELWDEYDDGKMTHKEYVTRLENHHHNEQKLWDESIKQMAEKAVSSLG